MVSHIWQSPYFEHITKMAVFKSPFSIIYSGLKCTDSARPCMRVADNTHVVFTSAVDSAAALGHCGVSKAFADTTVLKKIEWKMPKQRSDIFSNLPKFDDK